MLELLLCAWLPAELPSSLNVPYVIVLGIAQDAGAPQAGVRDPERWRPQRRALPASIAIVDPRSGKRWMIEATPAFPEQLHRLDEATGPASTSGSEGRPLDGLFLTHAHMGHYSGLIHLGREAMSTRSLPLYVMPRMSAFLRSNGPWSQLVELEQVSLRTMKPGVPVELREDLSVTPLLVPHRDEFSETVGFIVRGPHRGLAFIPDVDKWSRWGERPPIEAVIRSVDVALLDGTFFAEGELPHRSMAEIPHPFITESLKRFGSLDEKERRKIRFIHLNHTNPALDPEGPAARSVVASGMSIARSGDRHRL
ncbi:MAG: MBL fold metallo-hydrolase [Myxococcota bacterium]